MSLFGTTVELNMADVAQIDPLDERLTCQVLKKHKERTVFLEFLRSKLVDGKRVFEHMQEKALEADGHNISTAETVDFVLSELKLQANGLISPYKALVDSQITAIDPNMETSQNLLASGKIDPKQMPQGYPILHKRAEGIILAKVRESIKEGDKKYVAERKSIVEQMREMARELFFAINKLGLEGGNLKDYLMILFEISLAEEADQIQPVEFRRQLAESLISGSPLKLVHIKCLRFVYPKEGGVRILTNTKDVVIDGVLGKYSPKSEENLFPRLCNLRDLFERYGITIQFTVCLADNDLDLLFPEGNRYVNQECLEKARQNLSDYIAYLKQKHGDTFKFVTLNDLAKESGGKYKVLYEEVVQDLTQMRGRYVNSNFFERDRVNHQFEYYQRLFGPSYSRKEARRSIIAQTASTIALKESLRVLNESLILIEEDRGGENKLIAGGKVPVLFVKLRDEAKFDIQ